MKVLLINDFKEGGGAEGVFNATLHMFKDKGCDVECYTGSNYHSKPKNILEYFYNKTHNMELSIILKKFIPDVVLVHNYNHILTSSIFSVLKKYKKEYSSCKIVYTAHDFHMLCPSSNLLWYKRGQSQNLKIPVKIKDWLFKCIDHRGFLYSIIKKIVWFWERLFIKPQKHIDLVISPSKFLINAFQKSGIRNNMVCIRNPLGNDSNVNCIRIKQTQELKLVYFGRLSAEKGLEEFFELAVSLNLSLNIDVYGDGPERKNLKNYIKDVNGLEVNFLGRVDNNSLQDILPQYNIALIPSIGYENAPLTIPEAAKAGLVIWGTDIGGIKEMCETVGVPHFLFVPNEVKSFTACYSKLTDFCSQDRSCDLSFNDFGKDVYYSKLVKLVSK